MLQPKHKNNSTIFVVFATIEMNLVVTRNASIEEKLARDVSVQQDSPFNSFIIQV